MFEFLKRIVLIFLILLHFFQINVVNNSFLKNNSLNDEDLPNSKYFTEVLNSNINFSNSVKHLFKSISEIFSYNFDRFNSKLSRQINILINVIFLQNRCDSAYFLIELNKSEIGFPFHFFW